MSEGESRCDSPCVPRISRGLLRCSTLSCSFFADTGVESTRAPAAAGLRLGGRRLLVYPVHVNPRQLGVSSRRRPGCHRAGLWPDSGEESWGRRLLCAGCFFCVFHHRQHVQISVHRALSVQLRPNRGRRSIPPCTCQAHPRGTAGRLGGVVPCSEPVPLQPRRHDSNSLQVVPPRTCFPTLRPVGGTAVVEYTNHLRPPTGIAAPRFSRYQKGF